MPLPSGDFDKCANAMWSLHLGEAKGHDEARIHSVKDEMDGVIIFVRVHISVVTGYSNSMLYRTGWFTLHCLYVLSCR